MKTIRTASHARMRARPPQAFAERIETPTSRKHTAVLTLIRGKAGPSAFSALMEKAHPVSTRHPATMIASDGGIPVFGKASPHPRNYGTFARVLAVYVRELNTITLEDAIRKMSSFPAQRLGLTDRGLLRPGMKADVAVFDPARVRDTATFERPHQYAEGFSTVIINGKIVLDNGSMQSARPGRVLYHGR